MKELERAKKCLQSGEYTCVLCKDDKLYSSTDRGVKPLVTWLTSDVDLKGYHDSNCQSFCYASKRISRMKSVVAFSSVCTLSFSLICSIVSYIFAPQLIDFFINDATTIVYGSSFLRVLCIAETISKVATRTRIKSPF